MIETAPLLLSLSLLACDWSQTQQIAREPDRYYELNPMLGKHPSIRAVNVHFAKAAALDIGLFYGLPKPWGQRYSIALSVGETAVVARNTKLGLHVNFRF